MTWKLKLLKLDHREKPNRWPKIQTNYKLKPTSWNSWSPCLKSSSRQSKTTWMWKDSTSSQTMPWLKTAKNAKAMNLSKIIKTSRRWWKSKRRLSKSWSKALCSWIRLTRFCTRLKVSFKIGRWLRVHQNHTILYILVVFRLFRNTFHRKLQAHEPNSRFKIHNIKQIWKFKTLDQLFENSNVISVILRNKID